MAALYIPEIKMLGKTLLLVAGLFFSYTHCLGFCISETGNSVFFIDGYLRNDLVAFKNIFSLNSGNTDDTTAYMGIDYSLAFRSEFKDGGPKFYLKLERNGPFDYDAPLFVHNTLMNSGGDIERYRGKELLPQLEEFWIDAPVLGAFRFKSGLYTYEVGNGFSLNGGYENYSFALYRESGNFSWRLYYCRPDVVYKNHLGPYIHQEEEQDIKYEHGSSNFFALDAKIETGKNSFQPYVGVLSDYTSPGKRDNVFSAPIKKDLLGTFGIAWDLKQDDFLFKTELAHNFGKAESADAAYKDVYHTGYLFYANLDYYLGKFTPSFKFLLCSGNKVSLEAAADETLTSAKNRAFSCYSPLNKNLDDSISSSNSDMRPIVATGAGWGLNYGVPRPGAGAFYSSDFENLIMPSLGFDFNITEKLCLGVYAYYLRSFARGVGTWDGETKYLSQDLGSEIDTLIDYKLNKNATVSFTGGYFFPGRYYREQRDDAGGSLLSPFVRGDGEADAAYQIELSLELSF